MREPQRNGALPTPLDRLIDQRAPANAHEMWLQLDQRRTAKLRQNSERARTWLSVAACFVVLLGSSLALSAGFRLPTLDERPLLTAKQGALPAHMDTAQPYQAFDLSDGSRVTLVRGARLDVLETSPRTVSFALRDGRARFDVKPRGPRAWRIDCGAFSVEVVGTKFVLDRSAAVVSVEVLHGAVLVRGEGIPDGVQRLNAGQSLRAATYAPAAPSKAEVARAEPVLVPLEGAGPEGLLSAHDAEPTQLDPPARRRQRANLSSTANDSVGELFREADEARLEGRVNDAVLALARILDRHADDSRAALAGFALGRLQLTSLGRPALAAENFKLALSLGLPVALAEDAYGKLAEAYEKSGQVAAACAAWSEYARRFPRGAKVAEALGRCQVDAPR